METESSMWFQGLRKELPFHRAAVSVLQDENSHKHDSGDSYTLGMCLSPLTDTFKVVNKVRSYGILTLLQEEKDGGKHTIKAGTKKLEGLY